VSSYNHVSLPDPGRRSPRRPVIKVAAALIVRDGRILIGQRKKADSHGLKWEFPGGKIERGESTVDALARELEEELGIQAHIGREVVRYTWSYPKRATILLMFHRVTEFSGDPQSLAFERIAWEKPERLPEYDFLEGDIDFVRRLAAGEFNLAA
jgi:8-oxo-dGTP diphosphatase